MDLIKSWGEAEVAAEKEQLGGGEESMSPLSTRRRGMDDGYEELSCSSPALKSYTVIRKNGQLSFKVLPMIDRHIVTFWGPKMTRKNIA